MIKSVHWDITKNCNLRCTHCYNGEKYFNITSNDYIEAELSLNDCLRAIDSFCSAGFGHIHFLGGEPLASPHIFKVIKYAKEKNFIVTINSNACLLDTVTQEKLIELGVDHYAASIDGCTSEVNDSIRGVGTYDKVIENMTSFNNLIKQKNAKIETAFVYTLTKKNLNDLRLLPELAHKVGVNLIALTLFIETGKGKVNSGLFRVEIDELCEKIEELVAGNLRKYSIPLQIDMRPLFCNYLATVYNAPVIYNVKNSLCCAGEDIWYMEANGNVHPCLVFQLDPGKNALKKGVYVKEDIHILSGACEEIAKTTYWSSFLDEKHRFCTEKISTCKDCSYSDHCQPCFLEYGTYKVPIEECEWVKRKLLKLYSNMEFTSYRIREDLNIRFENNYIIGGNLELLELENEISLVIWKKLVENIEIFKITEQLLEEYEVSEVVLKQDITLFVYKLLNNKIIERVL